MNTTLLALIAAAAAALGLYAWGYKTGVDSAELKAFQEAQSVRQDSYEIAATYEKQISYLRQGMERSRNALHKALDRPAQCPKSGLVGDTVLPADLVDSMFNRTAPGPSGTEPNPAMR